MTDHGGVVDIKVPTIKAAWETEPILAAEQVLAGQPPGLAGDLTWARKKNVISSKYLRFEGCSLLLRKLAYPGLYLIFLWKNQQEQTILADYYTES